MKCRWLVLVAVAELAGCHTDMWVQPKTRPMEPDAEMPFGQSERPQVAGVVAFSSGPQDDVLATGLVDGKPVLKAPVQAAMRVLKLHTLHDLLERGRQRFDVFCSPCHGRLANGEGMIAQRGFALIRQPRNLHMQRIREAADGHLFGVITNGYGAMYSYADRVPPADRWAIVAYVRALELSEDAKGLPNG